MSKLTYIVSLYFLVTTNNNVSDVVLHIFTTIHVPEQNNYSSHLLVCS